MLFDKRTWSRKENYDALIGVTAAGVIGLIIGYRLGKGSSTPNPLDVEALQKQMSGFGACGPTCPCKGCRRV